MATTDIRFKRINDEYQSIRNAQNRLIDKVDTFETALLELAEAVNCNNDMLEAIITHLDIPYEPRTIGIRKAPAQRTLMLHYNASSVSSASFVQVIHQCRRSHDKDVLLRKATDASVAERGRCSADQKFATFQVR